MCWLKCLFACDWLSNTQISLSGHLCLKITEVWHQGVYSTENTQYRVPDKLVQWTTIIDSTCAVSSPNPMFDHLLKLSRWDDSNKLSNIWFGKEIGIIETKTEVTQYWVPDKLRKMNYNWLYLCYFFTKSYVWPLRVVKHRIWWIK